MVLSYVRFAIGVSSALWLTTACGADGRSSSPFELAEPSAPATGGASSGGGAGPTSGGASWGGAGAVAGGGGTVVLGEGGSAGSDETPGPLRTRPYEVLFHPEHVPTFHITIPWESLSALDLDGSVYQPATLQYEDAVVSDIGVRLKGRGSFRTLDEKASFKIKFNEFVSGQRFMGLRRLTLNNMVQDPTQVHECLGYWVFREAGVDASLCNHARVYVNGEFFGVYANVETIDRTFVEARYIPAPGNLYDTTNETYDVDFDRSLEQGGLFQGAQPPVETLYELETNTSTADTSDLTALIDAVSLSSDAAFLAEVDAIMDLDQVLLNAAVQAIIADWDGFFGGHNNYKAYHELGRDKFILLPWGIDQTFGTMEDAFTKLDYRIDGTNSERDRSLLFIRCLADSVCLGRYHDALRFALGVWDSLPLAAMADAMVARVAPMIAEPSRGEVTPAEHAAAVADLHRFLAERSARVWGQL